MPSLECSRSARKKCRQIQPIAFNQAFAEESAGAAVGIPSLPKFRQIDMSSEECVCFVKNLDGKFKIQSTLEYFL